MPHSNSLLFLSSALFSVMAPCPWKTTCRCVEQDFSAAANKCAGYNNWQLHDIRAQRHQNPIGNIFEAVDKNNDKEREGKTRIAATFRSTRRALRALLSRHITFRLRCRIHDDSLIRNPPYLKAPSWGIKNPGVQGLGWGTTWAQPDITSGSNAGHY